MDRCVSCKGRGFCGRPVCPILRRFREMADLPKIGTQLEGASPPDVFVGRQGYPLVSAGPQVPANPDLDLSFSSGEWARMDVGEIVALRSSMVRSGTNIEVKDAKRPGKILERAQEIAMSSVPVGTEVTFLKPPKSRLQFDGYLMPSGPTGSVTRLEITTNPSVPRKVDRVVEDSDLKAVQAVGELYNSGADVESISRLLSLGLLGKKRKMVPTRWSITATDDTAGKILASQILEMPIVNEYLLYSGERLGNHFEVLLMPGVYSYELIEIWLPRSVWSGEQTWIGADGEGPGGKKGYSSLSGGYYAARLALLESLASMKRQASALLVREISDAYWAPLGVWVVREAARAAFSSAPQKFSSREEALAEMEKRIVTSPQKWKAHSEMIQGSVQTTLTSFL